MAFDQSSVPLDLRPLNIGRAVVDESRLVTPVTGRNNMEGLYATPSSSRDQGNTSSHFPVYYHDHASGLVGLAGYGNAATPGGVAGWVQRIPSSSAVNYSPGGFYYSQNVNVVAHNRPISGNSSDQASDEGGDDSASGKKVKLMCSFGGKILPRLSDGALRYVGGQTRIISVRRDMSFNELVQKMVDSYGQNVVIKYQLPEEDLDALVSVSCHDDLENMMDEYEKLVERSMDGSVKLRVFLFSESELGSPGAVGHMGDVYEDGGQRYVEAVNGIVGGGGGGIMRRESILSAASTQNSELSGTETPEGTVRGQVDVLKLLSAVEVSPKNNSENSSHESTPRLVYVSPSPAIYGDAPSSAAVPLGTTIQVVTPRPPSSLSVQPGAVVQQQQQQQAHQQMCFDMPQQQHIGYAQPTSYLQATYMDPQHEALNRTADYVRNQYSAAQMGFPTQILGTVGPVFTQQQYRDNAVSVSSHQFIPATPITMTTPSSHANMKPNAVQPIIQPQQPVRMDRYPGENVNTYRQMVVQVPGDQSYNAYQTQVISPSGQGGYGWHQAAHQEQVAFSDGWLAHQQTMAFPEKLTRFEECYMCQKALPHAHSDTVAQTQKGSPTSARSDPNSVYHSFRLEENLRGRPINRPTSCPMTTTEDVIERKALLQPRVVDQMDGDSAAALSGVSQPLYSAVVVPQLYQENVVQKPVVPTSYQVKQDALTNKVVTAVDIASVSSSHSSDQLHESPQAYSSHHPAFIPKEGILVSSPVYDQLRQLDGRTEKCIVHPSEIFSNKEQVASPVNNPKKDETFQHNTFNKPKMALDANRYNQNETLLSPSNETHPYSKSFQSMDLREMTQSPLITTPPQQMIATNHLSPKETYGSPISGVDTPPQVTEKISTMIDWKDTSPSRFQPNSMAYNDLEAHRRLEENIISSLSPLSKVVDTQDNNSNSLFSSEDPWNMRNDNHFPPPRPNRFLARKDDPFGDNVSEETAFGNISGFTTESQPGDGPYQQSGNTSTSHTIRSSKAEEYIKQELQAVAEGVASSVLLPYFPSKSESDIQRRTSTGSFSEGHQDIQEVKTSEAPVQQKQKSHEDIKTKVPERVNLGFPVSDRLGRLQIIQNSDLEELRELGSGTFGTVYHGKWRGSDVAIKRINDRCFTGKPSEQERMRADFWNEAIKLADLHHPNVVAFYGVVLDGPGGSMATVTEFMVNGSLKTALQMNKKNLDKRKRLLIAMDVAFGMEYLHGKNLVHFDLKSDNLLVNLRDPHRPICKVGDLGLSKAKCQTLISGGVRGTLPWMAPELLNGISSLVSEKVDVFSFGIVLWELLTGDEPYADLHYGAIIGGIVSNSLRPQIPEYCDAEWRSLMEKCWTTEPSERPNFTVIANKLRAMAAKVPPKVHMHQQHQQQQQQQQQSPPQTQPQVKN